jgi:hypothetical protein
LFKPTKGESSKAQSGESSSRTKIIFWPKDLLPGKIDNVRILTFGYDVIARLSGNTSQLSLHPHAMTFANDIANSRLDSGDRPLIFVAHSLGGNLVKETLSYCSIRSQIRQCHLDRILPAVAGVCFLGTPHRGSDLADYGTIMAQISRVFLKKPNTDIIRSLRMGSPELEHIEYTFLNVCGSMRLHSFCEEHPAGSVMVVESYSSTLPFGCGTSSYLPKYHSQMTKVSDSEDVGYVRIVAVLQRWLWEIQHGQFRHQIRTHA